MKSGPLRIGRNLNTSPNIEIAGRLDELANIFAEQGANRFRVQAYRKAGNALRRLLRSVADIFKSEGIEGLEKIPGVGPSIARSIRDILLHGRLAMLDRLRGESGKSGRGRNASREYPVLREEKGTEGLQGRDAKGALGGSLLGGPGREGERGF